MHCTSCGSLHDGRAVHCSIYRASQNGRTTRCSICKVSKNGRAVLCTSCGGVKYHRAMRCTSCGTLHDGRAAHRTTCNGLKNDRATLHIIHAASHDGQAQPRMNCHGLRCGFDCPRGPIFRLTLESSFDGMGHMPIHTSLLSWSRFVIAVIASTAIAQAQNGATKGPAKFETPAAIQANAQFTKAVEAAHQNYVAALDASLKAAMAAGDLAEANAINGAKTALQTGGALPTAAFKSGKANEAKNAFEAANNKARTTYVALLQTILKPVLSSGKLNEANAIQSEIETIKGGSTKAAEGTSPNESTDLVVSGKGFTIATIQDNVPAFNNRGYVWQKVPAAIRGWRYTKTSGGSRAEIKVHAKQATVVQVVTDLTDPGVKLTGWDRTGIHFTYNNGKNADIVIFKKKLEAGQEIDIPQGNWGGVLVLLPTN